MTNTIPLVRVESFKINPMNRGWLLVLCENLHEVARIRKWRLGGFVRFGRAESIEDSPPKKIRCVQCARDEEQRLALKARELVRA